MVQGMELWHFAEGATYVWLGGHHVGHRQSTGILSYSEGSFEVFRPAGETYCTVGGEIWHGGVDHATPPCQISSPSVQQ